MDEFAVLSKNSRDAIMAGDICEYRKSIAEQATVLHKEGKYLDELKLLILGFHFAINNRNPEIDHRIIEKTVCCISKSGLSKYEVDEFYMDTAREDTTPAAMF